MPEHLLVEHVPLGHVLAHEYHIIVVVLARQGGGGGSLGRPRRVGQGELVRVDLGSGKCTGWLGVERKVGTQVGYVAQAVGIGGSERR